MGLSNSLPDSIPVVPPAHVQWFDTLLTSRREWMLTWAGIVSLVIALVDYALTHNLSLGFLYCFPILLAAPHLSRGQAVVTAMMFSVLREAFAPFSWEAQGFSRFLLVFVAYGGVGLFGSEVGRNRRLILDHVRRMQVEVDRRHEAERQLRIIIESSPAAILTVAPNGEIDMANRAAHDLFGVPAGGLNGHQISEFLPMVGEVLHSERAGQPYRAATSCRGRRRSGEPFLACVWFATYESVTGTRLAAVVTDSSDDLRDWQETSLQNLLRSTRVLVGSVSHEIRNICAAIRVVHTNLGRLPGVADSPDFEALGTLAAGLAKVTTIELQAHADTERNYVEPRAVLEELRIILEPQLASNDIRFEFHVPERLPLVQGDHHGLLQVFLNLTRNSLRALETVEFPVLRIEVTIDQRVLIRIEDNGPGVLFPERLFQPFQAGADAVGLGLFVARSIVRASGGELYHDPVRPGCSMCVALPCFYDGEGNPAAE